MTTLKAARALTRSELRLKKKTLGSMLAWWLIHHGWHYRITSRRTVVLVPVWDQVAICWNTWRMTQALIQRRASSAKFYIHHG